MVYISVSAVAPRTFSLILYSGRVRTLGGADPSPASSLFPSSSHNKTVGYNTLNSMTGKKTKQTPKGTKKGGMDKKKRHGPRLPSALHKELEHFNADPNLEQSDLEKDKFGEDVYEYDEETPEEETRKNGRYDSVDNYEYELPEEFEVS